VKKLFHLTAIGVGVLKAELEQLIARRGPIAERIRAAREFGDLSENAEYTLARQEQERVEGRISEIENILQNASLIEKPGDDHAVQLGSSVKLEDPRGEAKCFEVVGTIEADPLQGKISDESPLGQALLGKQVGETIEVTTRVEKINYTIIEIA
jgi:transcription elongation factor GreA